MRCSFTPKNISVQSKEPNYFVSLGGQHWKMCDQDFYLMLLFLFSSSQKETHSCGFCQLLVQWCQPPVCDYFREVLDITERHLAAGHTSDLYTYTISSSTSTIPAPVPVAHPSRSYIASGGAASKTPGGGSANVSVLCLTCQTILIAGWQASQG